MRDDVMTAQDLREFVRSARAVIGERASIEADATTDGSTEPMVVAAAQAGWFDLGEAGDVGALWALSEELGASGVRMPVVDHFISAQAQAQAQTQAAAGRPTTAHEVFMPVAAAEPIGAESPPLDGHGWASHVVMLDAAAGTVTTARILAAAPVDGLSAVSWHRYEVDAAEWRSTVGSAEVTRLIGIWLGALTARLLGAADESLELARRHAKERQAFGRSIAQFQAVSHRIVDQARAVAGVRILLEDALSRQRSDRDEWIDAVVLAAELAVDTLPEVTTAASHTLAAHGYFDDHPLPDLFRSAHVDAAALGDLLCQVPTTAERLLHGGSLPGAVEDQATASMRRSVRQLLGAPDDVRAGLGRDADVDLVARLASAELLTLGWPTEDQERVEERLHQHLVVGEELARAGIHLHAKTAADICGPLVVRHGSREQQRRWLPKLRTGALSFYLGYSEPEVGSDLARLRTAAVLEDDTWVVTGQKAWGTGAHRAEYVLLAARTDPTVRPQEGITLFLTPVRGRDGWSSSEHVGLSGEISSSTFFDDLRVPDADRLGPVNGGWKVLTEALVHERALMASRTATMLEIFRRVTMALPTGSGGDQRARDQFLRMAAALQAARLMSVGVALGSAAPRDAGLGLALAKITSGLLYEELCRRALAALGPSALHDDSSGALGPLGELHYHLRLAVMYVVGGGTVDIQRNLAARALGLGSSRRPEEAK